MLFIFKLKSKFMYKFNIFLGTLFIAALVGCGDEKEVEPVPSDPCASVKKDPAIIADFECQMDNLQLLDASDGKKIKLLDNKALEKVKNPDKSGINKSSHVGKFTDNGTNAWDNLFVGKFEKPIDLSTYNQLKIKVKTNAKNSDGSAVKLLAKLEAGTDSAKEVWENAVATDNSWKEYTFDFSDQASRNHKALVLFFNGGSDKGQPKAVFYIDDIRFVKK